MSSNSLHLDGVASFIGVLDSYAVGVGEKEADDDANPFKAHVLCRIFIIAQAAILVATNTCRQLVRGVTFILTGNFKLGFKDLVSAIIQVIALPILGVLAIFSPSIARYNALRLKTHFNPDCDIRYVSDASTSAENYQKVLLPYYIVRQDVDKEIQTTFFKIIACATASVQAVAYVIQGFLQSLLSFNFGIEQLAFPLVLIAAPIKSTIFFNEPNYLLDITAAHVHGIT